MNIKLDKNFYRKTDINRVCESLKLSGIDYKDKGSFGHANCIEIFGVDEPKKYVASLREIIYSSGIYCKYVLWDQVVNNLWPCKYLSKEELEKKADKSFIYRSYCDAGLNIPIDRYIVGIGEFNHGSCNLGGRYGVMYRVGDYIWIKPLEEFVDAKYEKVKID